MVGDYACEPIHTHTHTHTYIHTHIHTSRTLKYRTYTRTSDVLGGFCRLNVDSHKHMCKSIQRCSTPMKIHLKLMKYMSSTPSSWGKKSSSSCLYENG